MKYEQGEQSEGYHLQPNRVRQDVNTQHASSDLLSLPGTSQDRAG